MKAAFLTGNGQIELGQFKSDGLAGDEVRVKISNVGICGSDVHYYQHGKLGDNKVKGPHILGHEVSGVVTETGTEVKDLKAGDRVVLEPGMPCFTCEYCRTGNYNLCENMVFISVPGYHGAFREYINYSRLGVFKLPDRVSLKEAALIEPLAVGYNAAVTAGIIPGSSVCIIGAGPIGLTVLEAARIMGASTIMITDTDEHRLSIAGKHGADSTVNITRDDAVAKGLELTGGHGFNFVLDATGVPSAMESSVILAAKNGSIVFIGLGEESMRLSGYRMVKKQLTIRAVNRYANHFRPVINLLAAGKYNLVDFISHEFDFNDISEAFRVTTDPKQNKMKVMINFQ